MNLMKTWSAMILMLGGVVGAAPLPPVASEATNTLSKFTLQTVWRQTLDAPLMDAVFEEVEMTVKEAKAKGWVNVAKSGLDARVKFPRPKILVSSTGAILIDQGTGNTKRIPNSEGFHDSLISSSGKYFAFRRFPTEESVSGGIVFNTNGDKQYEVNEIPWAISNDGLLISIRTEEESPPYGAAMRNSIGLIMLTLTNPYVNKSLGEFQAKFSSDNRNILFVFSDTIAESSLTFANQAGIILWDKKIPYICCRTPEETWILPEVGVATILKEKTPTLQLYAGLLDWGGNLKWKFPLGIGGDYSVRISQNQTLLIVATTEGYIWGLNFKTGKKMWQHKESWAPTFDTRPYPHQGIPRFWKIEANDKFVFALGYDHVNWDKSELSIFELQTGRLLERIEYPLQQLIIKVVGNSIVLLDQKTGQASALQVLENHEK